jgi:hypothetical protein
MFPFISVTNINRLPNATKYESFAYHIELLTQFVAQEGVGTKERGYSMSSSERETSSSVHGSRVFQRQLSASSCKSDSGKRDNLSNSLPNYTGNNTVSRKQSM